jgi:hypothetical protein
MSARLRRLLGGLLLSLVVVVGIVGVLELALRTTHWFGARTSWSRPDATIGWRFTGNTDYWYDSHENDHPVVGRTNSGGWNDREWPLRKPPGAFRVAVLGDSYVEALQVEQAANFVSLAENLLNRDGTRRFELMNFGRSGFTQTEEWLVLKNEIVKFAPDLVALFYYAPNDIADVDPRTATDRLRPFPVKVGADDVVLDMDFASQTAFRLKSWMSPLKNHSALASLVAEKLARIQQTRPAAGQATGEPGGASRSVGGGRGIGGYLSVATDTPDPVYQRNYAVTKAMIAVMIRFCAQRRIPFLLVAIDTPAYLPSVDARLKTIDPSFRFDFFDDDLARFARESGARFLGLSVPFRTRYAARGEALHFSQSRPDDGGSVGNLGHPGHWNYAGHRYVAELLSEKLRAIAASSARQPRQ